MKKVVIVTDSTAYLPQELLLPWDLCGHAVGQLGWENLPGWY